MSFVLDASYVTVLPINSRVTIADGIEGLVVQICLTGSDGRRVQYQIAWWARGIRYIEWFEAFEVIAHPEKAMIVGFGVDSSLG